MPEDPNRWKKVPPRGHYTKMGPLEPDVKSVYDGGQLAEVTVTGKYPVLKHSVRDNSDNGGNIEHTLTWPSGKQLKKTFNPVGSPTKGWISKNKGFKQSDSMGIWNRMVAHNPRIKTNNRTALQESVGY